MIAQPVNGICHSHTRRNLQQTNKAPHFTESALSANANDLKPLPFSKTKDYLKPVRPWVYISLFD
jgi:hypothetical protein